MGASPMPVAPITMAVTPKRSTRACGVFIFLASKDFPAGKDKGAGLGTRFGEIGKTVRALHEERCAQGVGIGSGRDVDRGEFGALAGTSGAGVENVTKSSALRRK